MPSADASDALDLPRIERLGEDAVLLRFGTGIDAASNARVHSFSRQLDTLRPPWLIDVVPAYASLALFVDATAWPENCDPQTEAIRWLGAQAFTESACVAARLVSIDVHYGGGSGPDLESVARHSHLAP
ncbi:MAG: kipI, partial [Xanthomonadaceae bacterium]|nr:kipI [Xanthomonadaceae bacterium]